MRPVTISFLIITITLIITGCATTAVRESPTRWGFGLATMPGWQLSNGNMSIHAVLGYNRVNFNGGGGHNNFFQVGPQLRWNFSEPSSNGLWAGAEATYLNVSSKYDGNNSFNPSGSGYTIAPVLGYRFYLGKLPLNVYAAPAFLHRGELSDNNMVAVMANNGFYGRFGVDLQFMSLLSDKGR